MLRQAWTGGTAAAALRTRTRLPSLRATLTTHHGAATNLHATFSHYTCCWPMPTARTAPTRTPPLYRALPTTHIGRPSTPTAPHYQPAGGAWAIVVVIENGLITSCSRTSSTRRTTHTRLQGAVPPPTSGTSARCATGHTRFLSTRVARYAARLPPPPTLYFPPALSTTRVWYSTSPSRHL